MKKFLAALVVLIMLIAGYSAFAEGMDMMGGKMDTKMGMKKDMDMEKMEMLDKKLMKVKEKIETMKAMEKKTGREIDWKISNWGLFLGSGGNVGLAYNGDNYSYSVGVDIGYMQSDADFTDGYKSEDAVSYGFFAAKHMKIHDRTFLGFGTRAEFSHINIKATGPSNKGFDGNFKASQWGIAPYFVLSHHLSKHFMINATLDIVDFQFMDAAGHKNKLSEDTVGYAKPYFFATYLF